MNDIQAQRDIREGIRHLRTLDYVRKSSIATVGFGIGGTHSLLLACQSQDLSGVVCFSGPLSYTNPTDTKPHAPLDLIGTLSCPLLGFYAEEDEDVPGEDVKRLQEVLTQFEKPFEIHSYPETKGRFFDEKHTENYNPDATKDAWGKMEAFLKEKLTVTIPPL